MLGTTTHLSRTAGSLMFCGLIGWCLFIVMLKTYKNFARGLHLNIIIHVHVHVLVYQNYICSWPIFFFRWTFTVSICIDEWTVLTFRGDMMSNPQKGKWFKFNDTVVEEFEMTEDSLEAECFGGTYKAKILEPSMTSLSAILKTNLHVFCIYCTYLFEVTC